MPRIARIVVPGIAHHVTQRGNHQETVFFEGRDYIVYLRLLERFCLRHDLKVWAYCLMPNHVHLITLPSEESSLARALQGAHTMYAHYINQRQGWTGHLWQNRFFSCPMDVEHLWAAVRYVELNPVRAAMVRSADRHLWSSARVHIEMRPGASRASVDKTRLGVISPDCPLLDAIGDWREWLGEGNSREFIETIRARTRTGRPLGDVDFVKRLEGLLGRRLRPRTRGRKKREKSSLSPEKGLSGGG